MLQLIADFSRVESFEFIMPCSVCIRVSNQNALNGRLFHFSVSKIIVSSLNAVERILLHWIGGEGVEGVGGGGGGGGGGREQR